MKRRGFLGALVGLIAGTVLDPERLLWVPGEKLISIPSGKMFIHPKAWKFEGVSISDFWASGMEGTVRLHRGDPDKPLLMWYGFRQSTFAWDARAQVHCFYAPKGHPIYVEADQVEPENRLQVCYLDLESSEVFARTGNFDEAETVPLMDPAKL